MSSPTIRNNSLAVKKKTVPDNPKLDKLNLVTYAMETDISKKTMSIDETLRLAHAAGLKFVDAMSVSRAHELEEYISAGKRTGVGVYCYTTEISFLGNIDRVWNILKMQLRIASVLGAKLFLIIPYVDGDERKAKNLDKEQLLQTMSHYFTIAIKEAAKYGLRVCFENSDKDCYGLYSPEECNKLLEKTQGLGLVFNTAHAAAYGDDALKFHDAVKNYIVHVHLKDVTITQSTNAEGTPERVIKDAIPGSGAVPIREIYDSMLKLGYPGRFGVCYSHPDDKPLTLTQNSARLPQYLRWTK